MTRKNELFKQHKIAGYEEDQCEVRRKSNHDFLCWMRESPMLQQLFARRSQPIRFSEMVIQDIVGINIKDNHLNAMVNQFYQGLTRDVGYMFEAASTLVYNIETQPVQLDNGQVKNMPVPRKADPSTYSFVYLCRPSDGTVKRLIRWVDDRNKTSVYSVDSLFFKSSGYGKTTFGSECGILASEYSRFLRMREHHENAITKRAKSKPWIQHMSAQQNQAPQNALQYGASHPSVVSASKNLDVIEKDRYIMLPPEYVMCSQQPMPELDINMKEEEDRFNTIAAKVLRLASWETHDYTKSQYKNETQVAQETSQQRTVVLERHDDISSAIATIFCNCFGIYNTTFAIPIRIYAPYETLYQMYLDGVITEEVIKKNILDTHALDEDEVMPETMKGHRETILRHHRDKDAPKGLTKTLPTQKKRPSSSSKSSKSEKNTKKKKTSKD